MKVFLTAKDAVHTSSRPERNRVGHMSGRTLLGLAVALGVVGLSGVSVRAALPAGIGQASAPAASVAAPVPAKYRSFLAKSALT